MIIETRPIILASTLAVRTALDSGVLRAFEGAFGIAVAAEFEPTTVFVSRINAGYQPDVVIATTSAIEALAAAGHVVSTSVTPLVRSGIGLGVLHGSPHPDVSTVEALITTLLNARSVAYSREGQSGIHFSHLLKELGIADQVNATATVLEKGFTGVALVDERADLAVQQVSELRFVMGVEVVGTLPAPVQLYTEFSIALGTAANNEPEAQQLLTFLTGGLARTAYTNSGLTMPGAVLPRVLVPAALPTLDRGNGASTIALVTKAIGADNFLNGITTFEPGAAIGHHTHNCIESVVVVQGDAIVNIDGVETPLSTFDTTFVPADIPHHFSNASAVNPMRILWTYGSIDATRTIVATGVTGRIDGEHRG